MELALKLFFALIGGVVGYVAAYTPTVLIACFAIWPDRQWCALPVLGIIGPIGAIIGGVGGWRLARWTMQSD